MRFEDASSQTGFQVTTPAHFAQLGDVDGDGLADILVHAGSYPNRIYSTATIPFTDITSLLPKNSNVMDAIIEDFNGDLKNDIFLAVGKTTSDVYQPATNQVNVRAHINKEEKGITFKAAGKVTFDLEPFWTPTYFGSTGYRVPSTGYRSGLPDVTLSPDDPQNFGLKEHIQGSSNGIYIGYDPAAKLWTIVVSSGSSWALLGATITAEGSISEVTPIGITPFIANATNLMLVNSASGFTKVTDQAGLGMKVTCYSAAAGDNEKKLAGEIDPEYLFFPETAGRIAAHIPNAKLIFIFREPVSRAYSHYWMTVYRGLEKLDFATAIEKEQERMRLGSKAICHYSYVGRGYYFTQLQNYLKHFPRENMLFLLSDDLKHQPMQTLLKIYRFLGVEPIPYKPLPRELTHETGMPISMSLQDFLATPSLTKSVAKLLLPDSVRHYLRNLIMKKNKRPAHFPPIPAVIQIHLKKLYREEIINLSRIVQLDLDYWISLNSHDLKQSNNVYTI